MTFHDRLFRCVFRGVAAVGLLLLLLAPGLALAQDDGRNFADTGYTIADDAIWTFFNQYGGTTTFGEPVSREFTLSGSSVQLFQNAALQVESDGSVQVMQLTTQGWLPYTGFAGLTVPAADTALAFVAPTPDQPNYAARVSVFLQTVISEPFLSTFNATGGTAVWGLPTSSAKADPNNPNFVYQRFQNGILFYDATSNTTRALPLGELLKEILTGQNLPADLASEAANSSLRSGGLTHTELTEAFVPDGG